jgi:hypothetical protein
MGSRERNGVAGAKFQVENTQFFTRSLNMTATQTSNVSTATGVLYLALELGERLLVSY